MLMKKQALHGGGAPVRLRGEEYEANGRFVGYAREAAG